MQVPILLSDNELGDLRWRRPNVPYPTNPKSSYRRVGCIGDGSCFFHAIAKGMSEIYQLSYNQFPQISERTLQKFEESSGNSIKFPNTLFSSPRNRDPNTMYTFKNDKAFRNLMERFRTTYVKLLRRDFALRIANDPQMQGLVRKYLKGSIDLAADNLIAAALLKGQILDRASVTEQAVYTVKNNLMKELLSDGPVPPDFILLLSDFADLDIYLLRDADLSSTSKSNPLYGGSSLHSPVRGPADMRPPLDRFQGYPNRRAIVLISIDDFHYEIVARVDNWEKREIYPTLTQEEPLIRRLYEMLLELRNNLT